MIAMLCIAFAMTAMIWSSALSAAITDEKAKEGKSALVIGFSRFIGRNTALELILQPQFSDVFVLDETRERLLEPWEVQKDVLSGFEPTWELESNGVGLLRCDRSLPCLSEVLASRVWDLVVDFAAGGARPYPGGGETLTAPFREHASRVRHYVLISSAAIYDLCEASGRSEDVMLLKESDSSCDVQNESDVAPASIWRTIEAPLWHERHNLQFSILRVPDIWGEMEPNRALVPVIARLAHGGVARFPGNNKLGSRKAPFSVALEGDVIRAVTALHMKRAANKKHKKKKHAKSVTRQVFNLASEPISLEDIVGLVATMLKAQIQWVDSENSNSLPIVPVRYPLDTSKVERVLGVKPTSIMSALPKLVQSAVHNFFNADKSLRTRDYDFDDDIPVAREASRIFGTIVQVCQSVNPSQIFVQLAKPGAIEPAALHQLWGQFIYRASPVQMPQRQWLDCLLSLKSVFLAPQQKQSWTHSLMRSLLVVGDSSNSTSLEEATMTLFAESRTPTSFSWPPMVWGKVGELLMSIGRIRDAESLFRRALTFKRQKAWEKRSETLSAARLSLTSYQKAVEGVFSESPAQPLLRERNIQRFESPPSMAEFVEKCALPQQPAIIAGEVLHWEARHWRAESKMMSTCPNATATITYAQPQASLEFANLAHHQMGQLQEYVDTFMTSEAELQSGLKGASQRLTIPDKHSKNRTRLSSRSPYFWDLSLHDECPTLLSEIRVPKYFADDLFSDNVKTIGGQAMVVWPTMMLGGAGTGSACHQDRKGTPFWLAMLHGQKQVVMYSPDDAYLLYPFGMLDQGAYSSFRFDPFDPDYDAYPNARAASMYSTLVKTGEILWIPPLWVHCLVNIASESIKTPPDSSWVGQSQVYSYNLAMVFNYHDTFSLPTYIEQCADGLGFDLCAFMPTPKLVDERLAIRVAAATAVAANNRSALEGVLSKVNAWSKDRWNYFEFRELLGGRDFIAQYCASRLGFDQTCPHLTSFCADHGVQLQLFDHHDVAAPALVGRRKQAQRTPSKGQRNQKKTQKRKNKRMVRSQKEEL